jgi:hypothetical protein
MEAEAGAFDGSGSIGGNVQWQWQGTMTRRRGAVDTTIRLRMASGGAILGVGV